MDILKELFDLQVQNGDGEIVESKGEYTYFQYKEGNVVLLPLHLDYLVVVTEERFEKIEEKISRLPMSTHQGRAIARKILCLAELVECRNGVLEILTDFLQLRLNSNTKTWKYKPPKGDSLGYIAVVKKENDED